ncbi:hypothetical protein BABINDRAFT_163316 [Babjeviella inositovora NRRL Y-12698]|uniref:Alpha/beta hydrolase fold-3 domain-containing protein n=1 Tax=Babjeviella inositovora NRRL Y-12698 TaxID=984486 RepID=A0A1E3QJF0_9ASCO|nr:uncharacterized protein BABINDRAFT_163316 [Babjeviella inositovora NRRL Y-12698]ODQ77584.1 hypothetical protein BABINDRAFT_163316 [Babjeviella inositovora NRRL Y-12698]
MSRVTPDSSLLWFRSSWAIEWTHIVRAFLRKGGFEEVDILYTRVEGFDEFKNVKGLWIYSNSARKMHGDYDIIHYYIPGGGFMVGSAYLYLEFMQSYTLALLEQGFSNPAIFVPDLTLLPAASYPGQLSQVSNGWKYLTKNYPGSKIILSGDSTGGTLALGLLLHIAKASVTIEKFEQLERGLEDLEAPASTESRTLVDNPITSLVKPHAVMIISPVTSFKGGTDDRVANEDFLTTEILRKWGSYYMKNADPLDFYHSPGECQDDDLWRAAFPEVGMIVTYGENELVRDDIASFCERISKCGKTKTIKIEGSIHSGPILTFYTERKLEERELHVHVLACNISRMLLWETERFLDQHDSLVHAGTI